MVILKLIKILCLAQSVKTSYSLWCSTILQNLWYDVTIYIYICKITDFERRRLCYHNVRLRFEWRLDDDIVKKYIMYQQCCEPCGHIQVAHSCLSDRCNNFITYLTHSYLHTSYTTINWRRRRPLNWVCAYIITWCRCLERNV